MRLNLKIYNNGANFLINNLNNHYIISMGKLKNSGLTFQGVWINEYF